MNSPPSDKIPIHDSGETLQAKDVPANAIPDADAEERRLYKLVLESIFGEKTEG